MIVLDTHIWVWWVHGDEHLSKQQTNWLQENEEQGLGVSIISCWEVAKLVEYGRLALPCPVAEWFDQALGYPGISLLDLTPRIVVDSTQLPKGSQRSRGSIDRSDRQNPRLPNTNCGRQDPELSARKHT